MRSVKALRYDMWASVRENIVIIILQTQASLLHYIRACIHAALSTLLSFCGEWGMWGIMSLFNLIPTARIWVSHS